MTLLHGENLIASRRTALNGKTFHAADPASGAKLEPAFHDASAAEVEAAMELAAQAFPVYSKMPADRIAGFLRAIADKIMALGDALIERAGKETGLPPARLTGERARTVGQLRMFADLVAEGSWIGARIDRAIRDRQPAPKPDLRRMLVPLGPVVVFGSSNFPFAFSVAGGDTASALAAGCPVVKKAHRGHPGTSEMVAGAILEAARETGMPDGVFSMLHGPVRQVGVALVQHPAAAAVGFTGSVEAGRALFDAAAQRSHPIPVHAEMGSVNPVFILPEAAKQRGEQIAQGLSQSVTLGVGQFCTKPGMVFGMGGEHFRNFVAAACQKFNAIAPGTMLHQGIADSYRQGVEARAAAKGVRVAAKSASAPTAVAHGVVTIFETDAATFLHQKDLSNELFGPSTIVVHCASHEELMRVAQGLDGHLTATIHATEADIASHRDLIEAVTRKVGRVVFNGFPTGVEVCPSMQHGGPYPATTDSRTTSVGTAAIDRFVRPVCYQDCPQQFLPPELRDENPRKIMRIVDGKWTRESC